VIGGDRVAEQRHHQDRERAEDRRTGQGHEQTGHMSPRGTGGGCHTAAGGVRLARDADARQPGSDGQQGGGRVPEGVEHRLPGLDADREEGRVQQERRQPALRPQQQGGVVAHQGGHRCLS
jgi:hypothetical protein